MSATDDSIQGGFEPATNVLLLAPTLAHGVISAYPGPLTATLSDGTDVLIVTLVRPAAEHLANWRETGHEPGNIGIVEVAPGGDSPASPPAIEGLDASASVATVPGPGDLTNLGVQITGFLERWEDSGNPTVLYFDSLTPLLQYVDVEAAFRFLTALTRQSRSYDAVAHFHLGENAHEEETIETLGSLFDETIRVAEDGQFTSVTPD